MAPTQASLSPLDMLLRNPHRVVSPDDPEVVQAAFSWFLGTPRGASRRTPPSAPPSTPQIGRLSTLNTYPDGTPRRSRRSNCQCSPTIEVDDYSLVEKCPPNKKPKIQGNVSADDSDTPYIKEFIKFLNSRDLTHKRLFFDTE